MKSPKAPLPFRTISDTLNILDSLLLPLTRLRCLSTYSPTHTNPSSNSHAFQKWHHSQYCTDFRQSQPLLNPSNMDSFKMTQYSQWQTIARYPNVLNRTLWGHYPVSDWRHHDVTGQVDLTHPVICNSHYFTLICSLRVQKLPPCTVSTWAQNM